MRSLTFIPVLALLVGAAAAQQAPIDAPPIVNPFATTADLIDCTRDKTTLVSGHRGGIAPGYPENAIETFARTLSRTPMLLEVDVRTTADGVLVLMHDETVDRTTTGEGPVANLSWDALSKLSLKDNWGTATAFRIPRLEHAIRWAEGRGILLLDMKPGVSEAAVAALIGTLKAQARTGVIVYGPDQAARLFRADPTLTLFYPANTEADLTALTQRGVALDHLVVFTGIETQQPAFWRTLAARDLPVAFGTLFFTDRAIAMTGGYDHFAYLSDQGVAVLPTDLHEEAFAAIDARRNVVSGLHDCGVL